MPQILKETGREETGGMPKITTLDVEASKKPQNNDYKIFAASGSTMKKTHSSSS